MKTLRVLRNIAALFILVAALVVSRPSAGLAGARPRPHCVKTSANTNCYIVGQTCNTQICFFGCTHTACPL